jgi:hypothetical protein
MTQPSALKIALEARSLASVRMFDGSQPPAAREALDRAVVALTDAIGILRPPTQLPDMDFQQVDNDGYAVTR